MATPIQPPREAWHRRYWDYVDRPYKGFGCLWTFLVAVVIYLLIAWLFAALWIGYR